MNVDPRFKSDASAHLSLPEPIPLAPPAWLPWREIAGLGLLTAGLCAGFALWLDRPIAVFFAAFSEESWVGFFRTITIAGNSAFWYTPAVLCFVAALWLSKRAADRAQSWEWRRRARGLMFMITSMMLSGTIVNGLKITFGRYRPRFLFSDGLYGFQPFELNLRDSGFPSGHTQSITAAMIALGFLFPRGRYVFWGFAVVIAASRFITTVHYTADVIGGAFVAVAVAWTLKRYYERNGIALAWSP